MSWVRVPAGSQNLVSLENIYTFSFSLKSLPGAGSKTKWHKFQTYKDLPCSSCYNLFMSLLKGFKLLLIWASKLVLLTIPIPFIVLASLSFVRIAESEADIVGPCAYLPFPTFTRGYWGEDIFPRPFNCITEDLDATVGTVLNPFIILFSLFLITKILNILLKKYSIKLWISSYLIVSAAAILVAIVILKINFTYFDLLYRDMMQGKVG